MTEPFRIDGGSLVVDVPQPGDGPRISTLAAACVALASISADGVRFGNLARSGGVRIGLARVTVADSVAADSDRVTVGDGDVQPNVGTVPALCGGPGRMAPSVSVPADGVSVAWSMTARNPDGYSATITADMQTCDGYDPLVLPDEDRPAVVQVLVQRPIGRACGVLVHRRLTLHAAEVTASLPVKLVHAPTGLSVPSPDPAVQSSPPR